MTLKIISVAADH